MEFHNHKLIPHDPHGSNGAGLSGTPRVPKGPAHDRALTGAFQRKEGRAIVSRTNYVGGTVVDFVGDFAGKILLLLTPPLSITKIIS
jgi:hypothetical protein